MHQRPARYFLWLAVLSTLWLSPVSAGQNSAGLFEPVPAGGPPEPVSVRIAWAKDRARPGDRIGLAIVVDVQTGYHINADPGQVVARGDFKPYPTRIRILEVAPGMTVDPPRFPKAHAARVQYAAGELMFFDGRTVIYLPVTLDRQISPGIYGLKLELSYQACDDRTCLFPQKKILAADISVVQINEAVNRINIDIFDALDASSSSGRRESVGFDLFGWRFSIDMAAGPGFILLLVIAALGGVLLNFTPCVLPLVPIKIISLSHAAEQDQKRSILLGLFMFLGVLAFWLVLGAMIAMVSGFTATNQLFQYPAFTLFIGVIIAVMAMGMCGMFHARLPGFIYRINPDQESLPGCFAMGILIAVLSTPCTAPFMGAAAAWAATRPPVTTLSTFAAIGVGMALPYLILSAWPGMIRKIPKTGPGSMLLKEVMGLFMMAAAAYFIGSGLSALFTRPPSPPSKLYWWAVVAFCAVAGGWLIFRTFRITAKQGIRAAFTVAGLLVIAGSVWAGLRLTDRGPIDWVDYTPQRFESAVAHQKTVVMVFTAEWCLNCKALEQSVFHSRRISELLSAKDVVPMKVDITGNNPPGKAKLREVGSLTIPLLVVFSPEGTIVFKNDFYTVDQVLEAVDRARKRRPPVENPS